MKNSIALFLIILLASCGKERTIQISARNAATGEAYGGLHYVVGYSTTTGSGEKSHTVHSGNLDDNGLATVVVRVKRNRTYYVHVDEPENTCYNKFITMYFNSPFHEDGHFNFEFAECSSFKLSVHNTNCIDENDEIKFRRVWLSGNEFNDFVIQTGCFQFDGDQFSLPQGEYKYEWIVTKNGITTNYDSVFFLAANESKIFSIDY